MCVDNDTGTGTFYASDIRSISGNNAAGLERRFFFAVDVYVVLGVAGLPVFSGFRSGIGVLLGATGGYIVGFLLAPFIMLPFERRGRAARILSAAAALVACYVFGTLWYAFVYMSGGKEFDILSVLLACVVPFIIPDVIKIALSFLLFRKIKG